MPEDLCLQAINLKTYRLSFLFMFWSSLYDNSTDKIDPSL